jgi:hypothetical protein
MLRANMDIRFVVSLSRSIETEAGISAISSADLISQPHLTS